MTRRRFIIGGVVAVVAGLGVVGAATHGFGIPDYLGGIRGSLDDYTWDQLQEISLKIKAAETRSEAREIAKRYHLLDADGHIPIRAPSVSRSPTDCRLARSLWASATMSFWTGRARPG